MTQQVAAILLAAGLSRRMGTCKQLLQLEGRPVIARCLESLLHGGTSDLVVVVSTAGDEVARVAGRYPVLVVQNTDPEGDMASSVRAGRDLLMPGVTGVLVALCDYPLVTAETVSCLIVEHHRTPREIIIPCHDGRRGHPSLFPRRLLDDLEKPLTLRDLMSEKAQLIRHLEVPDPGVLVDMDTPEDYRRISGMLHRDLG
jgi:molybdenum cofactor cytidylyltransferase